MFSWLRRDDDFAKVAPVGGVFSGCSGRLAGVASCMLFGGGPRLDKCLYSIEAGLSAGRGFWVYCGVSGVCRSSRRFACGIFEEMDLG